MLINLIYEKSLTCVAKQNAETNASAETPEKNAGAGKIVNLMSIGKHLERLGLTL